MGSVLWRSSISTTFHGGAYGGCPLQNPCFLIFQICRPSSFCVDLYFRQAKLISLQGLYRCSVGELCGVKTIYLVILGYSCFHLDVHWYSSFPGSTFSGASYCSPRGVYLTHLKVSRACYLATVRSFLLLIYAHAAE